jgi:arsenical pump membrane protein
VEAVAAYSSFAVTLGLILARPRLGQRFRVGPAHAGALCVALMLASGVVQWTHVTEAAAVLWRPLAAIVAMMVTSAAAHRLGVLDQVAARTVARSRGGPARWFAVVFALGVATSAILNNDSAILLLTPVVVGLVRRRYPARPGLVVPFAFAVFAAAGVAPFVVSNPMNMIVASYAGLGFNAYAWRMVPIAIAGWALAFVVLRLLFARDLAVLPGVHAEEVPAPDAPPFTAAQIAMLAVLGLTVGAYPVVSYLGGPIWAVAGVGACASALLGARYGRVSPTQLFVRDVAWDIVFFLISVSVIGVGLRNVGLVDHFARAYQGHAVYRIGVLSAVGSAVLNNHPMSIVNMMALQRVPGAGTRDVLAALIGGDLGPRLFPMGSLAGLLWIEALRRQGVPLSTSRFMLVGLALTVPCLVLSLAMLSVI